jgi:hypothetical protein
MFTTRRRFLEILPAAAAATSGGSAAGGAINRHALVARHNPRMTAFDALTPLTIGNGEFAFTADPTGLQTFPEWYEEGLPLCTQSQWGWHSAPAPSGLSEKDLRLEMFDTYGRQVGYPTNPRGQEPLFNWLRENPHRLHLGRIGLAFPGRAVRPGDLRAVSQTLDLWSGILESSFELEGALVTVHTSVDPAQDAVAFRIASRLWGDGRLGIAIEFSLRIAGHERGGLALTRTPPDCGRRRWPPGSGDRPPVGPGPLPCVTRLARSVCAET